MLIRLSETHSPSRMDLAGIVIIMAGYAPMVRTAWRSSHALLHRLGSRNWYMLLVLAFAGMMFILSGLYIENDLVLWLAVAVSTLAQSVIIFQAFKSR